MLVTARMELFAAEQRVIDAKLQADYWRTRVIPGRGAEAGHRSVGDLAGSATSRSRVHSPKHGASRRQHLMHLLHPVAAHGARSVAHRRAASLTHPRCDSASRVRAFPRFSHSATFRWWVRKPHRTSCGRSRRTASACRAGPRPSERICASGAARAGGRLHVVDHPRFPRRIPVIRAPDAARMRGGLRMESLERIEEGVNGHVVDPFQRALQPLQ